MANPYDLSQGPMSSFLKEQALRKEFRKIVTGNKKFSPYDLGAIRQSEIERKAQEDAYVKERLEKSNRKPL